MMNVTQPDGVDDAVVVELPARTEFASTLRLLITSFGADSGFSVDEIDDLRLGVNEIFMSAVDNDAHRLTVTFAPSAGAMTVRLSSAEPIDVDELAATILRSVADDFELVGGTATIRKSATDRQ